MSHAAHVHLLLQVKAIRAQSAKVHRELEGVFAAFFKKHPLLAPLGEAAVVGWVVTAVLAAPLLALLLPALLLKVPPPSPTLLHVYPLSFTR